MNKKINIFSMIIYIYIERYFKTNAINDNLAAKPPQANRSSASTGKSSGKIGLFG